MSIKWPLVALGDVLQLVRKRAEVQPGVNYKRLTVRMNALGVVLRDIVDGAAIRTETQFLATAGQFVFSRIDARNGAFGLIPYELDGSVVSGNFFTVDCVKDRLLPEYLRLYTSRHSFWDDCAKISEGTTNRVPVRIEQFLALTIPLPALAEQRRIVAKVEKLAGKIEEAWRLRNQSVKESEALAHSISRKVFQDTDKFRVVQLKEVCSEIIDCLHSNPIYSELGIPTVRSPDVGWGRLFLKSSKKTSEEEYRRRTSRGEPKPGDIILVREGGGTGKAGVVEEGQRLSLGQRVMQLRPNKEKVLPRFLLHQWLSPLIQEDQIGEMMKGSASPHLNIGSLKKFNFILPPIEEQRHIVTYLDRMQAKTDALNKHQVQTAAELEALMSSILDKAFKGEL
jgi:type I restriction enzyme S subunit